MNIDRDHLRRELRDTQEEHTSSMVGMKDFIARLLDPSSKASDGQKADLILSGLNRRRFLKIGGTSVLAGAVLAACGSDDKKESSGATGGDDAKGSTNDLAILRTASSLEHVAIDVYQKAIDNAGALGITAAVADVAKLFQAQHKDHAAFFESATKQLGGKAFTTANPAVMQSLQSRIMALKTQSDVLMLARDLENVAAATYQSTVGAFDNLTLNAKTMSVGGVEARHAAVLNGVLKADQFPTKAFHTTSGAVAVGTGV
jgi:hypothetical protein